MSSIKSKSVPDSELVVKAGIWYTICNFLFRGMAFITTPIFARLLTKGELGSFSNISSWVTILTVVTAFDLQTSIIRSKLEHEDDMDSYIWSILSLTSIATLAIYFIVNIFPLSEVLLSIYALAKSGINLINIAANFFGENELANPQAIGIALCFSHTLLVCGKGFPITKLKKCQKAFFDY